MFKRFPRYLSAPFQVLWFETDELAIILMCFVLAMLFGSLFWIGLFAGPYYYGKLKKSYPRGFLKHTLYFIGLSSLKGYPTYFEKEFSE